MSSAVLPLIIACSCGALWALFRPQRTAERRALGNL